jgi:hypothetical protein
MNCSPSIQVDMYGGLIRHVRAVQLMDDGSYEMYAPVIQSTEQGPLSLDQRAPTKFIKAGGYPKGTSQPVTIKSPAASSTSFSSVSIPKSNPSWFDKHEQTTSADDDGSGHHHHHRRHRNRDRNTYVYYTNDYNPYNSYMWPPYYYGYNYAVPPAPFYPPYYQNPVPGSAQFPIAPAYADPSFADQSMVYKCMWDYESNPGMCDAVFARQTSAGSYWNWNPLNWFW